MSVESLVDLFAPWQSIYSDSTLISTSITAVHVVALLIGGGLAIATDRSTLRALRGGHEKLAAHLVELHQIHRPVIVSLFVLAVSGLLMATADLETFLGTPVFWLKLALVASLLINGALLYRTETRMRTVNAQLEGRLAWSSRLSVLLWILTAIAGTVLSNV